MIGRVLSLSLSSMVLTLWRTPVSSSVSGPQFGLSDVFPWVNEVIHFRQECHRSVMWPSQCLTSEGTCLFTTLSFPHKEITTVMKAHLAPDLTRLVPCPLGTWAPMHPQDISAPFPSSPCPSPFSFVGFYVPTLPGVPWRRWLSSAWSPNPTCSRCSGTYEWANEQLPS